MDLLRNAFQASLFGSVSLDLPWPDFSFFPPLSAPHMPSHPLKTPRWQVAHPSLMALGAKLPFDARIDRAVFTGNMKTSPNRQTIFKQAQHHPELLFVNEVCAAHKDGIGPGLLGSVVASGHGDVAAV